MDRFIFTEGWVRTSFNKYNEIYFNGELDTPRFEITYDKSYAGLFWNGVFPNNRKGLKFDRARMVLVLSNHYWHETEKDCLNVLLHEMIHQYVEVNYFEKTGIQDDDSHGHIWQSVADRINKDGWNIIKQGNLKLAKYFDTLSVVGEDEYGVWIMRFAKSKKDYYLDTLEEDCNDWFFISSKDKRYQQLNNNITRFKSYKLNNIEKDIYDEYKKNHSGEHLVYEVKDKKVASVNIL